MNGDSDGTSPVRGSWRAWPRSFVWATAVVVIVLLVSVAAIHFARSNPRSAPVPRSPTTTSSSSTSLPVIASGLDLRVLVVAGDRAEPEYQAAVQALSETGIAYSDYIVSRSNMTGPQLAAFLSDRPDHGRFNAVVITAGNLVSSAPQPGNDQVRLGAAQRAALEAYEVKFGVRSVTLNTYPDAAFGLTYLGYLQPGGAAIPANLTDAGKLVFPNVNTASPLPLLGTGVYLASVNNPATATSLITVTGPDGRVSPLASVFRGADGHENLAITAGNGPGFVHSILLSYGWIEWVTRGVHLGQRRPSLDVQVDDLFLTVALWDPKADRVSKTKFRNSGADIDALVAWLHKRRLDASTASLTIDFAFVGSGTNKGRYPHDTLLPAVQAHKGDLRFINHTFSHYDLDCGAKATCGGAFEATASDIEREIDENIVRGRKLGLSSDWDTMVQPDVSGVNHNPNSDAEEAAAHAGIRYWISDTSRPDGRNPTFNVGIQSSGDGRIYVVPRHPTNLFYDDSTPEQWVAEYNHSYGPNGVRCKITKCFAQPQSYAQILDHESDIMVRYLLTGDDDPLMFHTPNTRAYDGTHSLLLDLLDATLTKYDALTTTPILTPTFKQIAAEQKARHAFNASGVSATVQPCKQLVLRTSHAAAIPISLGTGAGTIVDLKAGEEKAIPLAAC